MRGSEANGVGEQSNWCRVKNSCQVKKKVDMFKKNCHVIMLSSAVHNIGEATGYIYGQTPVRD
jgi:hypothetical protein